jgi:hypothetical protein
MICEGKTVEEWRDIPGFEGSYQASSEGRIRSLARTVDGRWGSKIFVPETIKSQCIDRYGYPCVGLSIGGGRSATKAVHTLVLSAFAGPRPSPRHQACHNDGSRANNHASNLRWGLPKENYNDRRRHNTDASGSRNPAAKLTEAKVRLMRQVAPQFLQRELAEFFGIAEVTVSKILLGYTWRAVGRPSFGET